MSAIRRATDGEVRCEPQFTALRTQPLAHAATASAALSDSGPGHVGLLRDALALLVVEGQDAVIADMMPNVSHCVLELSDKGPCHLGKAR